MIDAGELATTALSILTPFVQGAGKELAESVGEAGMKKAEALFTWLKHKFANDPLASNDISRFERNPAQFGAGLAAALKDRTESDPEFASRLAEQVHSLGPVLNVFQEIQKGKKILGLDADQICSGQVTVEQRGGDIDDATAVRIKRLG